MACIRIGSRWFSKKGDAIAEVRRVLHQSPLGDRLTGADADLLAALFAMHPGYATEVQRKGNALGFCVQEHDYHGTRTRGFYALHLRSMTAFSYQTCLDPRRAIPNALAVMRAAIKDGQQRAKLTYFGYRETAPCPRCAKDMAYRDAHADHEPPKFREIAAAYFAAHGKPECISAALGDQFADPRRWNHWIAYHDARAKITVVCAGCNYAAERKAAE